MDFSRSTNCAKCGTIVLLREAIRFSLTTERVPGPEDIAINARICQKCAKRVQEFLGS